MTSAYVPVPHYYEFEGFRLEPERQQLFYENNSVAVTAKVFDLLLYLIIHRQREVSSEELLQQLWADVTVMPENVRVTVHRLRKLLTSFTGKQSAIIRASKGGYRFVGSVTELSQKDSVAPPSLPPPSREKTELKAEQFHRKGQQLIESHEPRTFEKGLSFLREAVRLNPKNAQAWVDIANSYNYLGTFHINSPPDVYPLAEQALQKALAIDPQLPTAFSALGSIKLFYYWKEKESAKLFEQAVQLAPNSATVHYQFGMLKIMSNKAEQAIVCMQRSIELKLLFWPAHTGLAQAFGLAGKMNEAKETLQNLLTLEAEFNFGHYYLSRVYLIEEQFEEALAEAEQACRLLRHPMTLCLLGFIKAKMGRRQEVRAILRSLKEMGKHKFLSPYYLAEIYLGLGDYDRALHCLESAFDMRMPQLFRLKLEPLFRNIIKDARLTPLIRRIKLT